MNNGYKEVLAKGDPSSRKSGWIYEHRLEAAKMLKRPLKSSEYVHHRDEDRTNNSPSNLMVFASNADHARFHRSGIAYLQEDGTYCTVSVPRKQRELKTKACAVCGAPCCRKYCSHQCSDLGRRKACRPTKDELYALLQSQTLVSIGAMFGVSGNAVKKWAQEYGIYKPKYKRITCK